MTKTAGGLDENLAGALAYALGWITGAAFLLIEPSNPFVRFHAMQSLLAFGGLTIAWIIVTAAIPFLGWLIGLVIIPWLSVGLWLFLMYKAYRGERYKLPFVGDVAERHVH